MYFYSEKYKQYILTEHTKCAPRKQGAQPQQAARFAPINSGPKSIQEFAATIIINIPLINRDPKADPLLLDLDGFSL